MVLEVRLILAVHYRPVVKVAPVRCTYVPMLYNKRLLIQYGRRNFDYAGVGMRRKENGRFCQITHGFRAWCHLCGWKKRLHQVQERVVYDYLREKPAARITAEALLELETRYCRQEPYITWCYIHVTSGANRREQG